MMSRRPNKTKVKKAWRVGFIGAGALLLLFVGFQLLVRVLMKPDPVGDIFSLLQNQGYTPSFGFAGTFEAGNIIQIMQRGATNIDVPLNPPLLFMWGPDCFPSSTARDSTFVLPETS